MVNPFHTQHHGRYSENEDKGAGLSGNVIKDQGAGPDGNMTKDELVGPDQNVIKDKRAGPNQNMIKDELAGPDGNMTEDELAGLDLNVIKDEWAGPDQNMIEDELAGPDGNMIEDEPEEHEDVNKDKPAGLDENMTEDEPARLDDKPLSEEVRRIKGGGRRAMKWVKVNMVGEELDLYCNTGSSITIITPAMYRKSMGKVVAAKSYLRAWGSNDYLDTKGMFKTTLTTASGATKRT